MAKMLCLDILRVIAIFFIIISHASFYLSTNPVESLFSTYFANFGLALFIFLSGYSLYLNNHSISSSKEIIKFYKKRVIRIFPLYWVAVISFVILFGILVPVYAPVHLVTSYQSDFISYFTPENIFLTFLGLDVFLAPQYATPIFTLWYIGLILILYFLYPFLVFLSRNSKEMVFYSTLIFIFFIILRHEFNIVDLRFFDFYPIFILGIMTCRSQIFTNKAYSKYLILLPSLVVFSLILGNNLKTIVPTEFFEYLFNQSVFFILFAGAFCVIQLFFAMSFSGTLSERAVILVSSIAFSSYCVYLFHRQFLTLVYGACYILKLGPALSDCLVVIGIPILFTGSYYFQKLMNKIGY